MAIIDIDAEILAREVALEVATKLAHVKAREAYKAAFRTTYNATVAENPHADAARHGAGEVAKQGYCNVACTTFLAAMPNEIEGEDE
jgi:hypothetical protein